MAKNFFPTAIFVLSCAWLTLSGLLQTCLFRAFCTWFTCFSVSSLFTGCSFTCGYHSFSLLVFFCTVPQQRMMPVLLGRTGRLFLPSQNLIQTPMVEFWVPWLWRELQNEVWSHWRRRVSVYNSNILVFILRNIFTKYTILLRRFRKKLDPPAALKPVLRIFLLIFLACNINRIINNNLVVFFELWRISIGWAAEIYLLAYMYAAHHHHITLKIFNFSLHR